VRRAGFVDVAPDRTAAPQSKMEVEFYHQIEIAKTERREVEYMMRTRRG